MIVRDGVESSHYIRLIIPYTLYRALRFIRGHLPQTLAEEIGALNRWFKRRGLGTNPRLKLSTEQFLS
jgi:hypothetical protein